MLNQANNTPVALTPIPAFILKLTDKQLHGYAFTLSNNLRCIRLLNWCPWMKDRWTELLQAVKTEQTNRLNWSE